MIAPANKTAPDQKKYDTNLKSNKILGNYIKLFSIFQILYESVMVP